MKKLVYRFLIYGVVIAYILLDIQVFKGPMHNWVLAQRGRSVAELREQGVAATVYGQPILKTQVEFRLQEYLYKRGRLLAEVSEGEYPSLFNYCLEELVLEHLLRIKVHHNEKRLKAVTDEVIELENSRDKAQFTDEREMLDALARQGYENGEFELRSAGYLQQLNYLDLQIDVDNHITPESSIAQIPELRRIRHIFYTTWQKDPSQEVREVQDSLGPLRTGWADFATISDRINDDPKAKKTQGELGWVTRHRLPEGLAESLFAMRVGEQKILQSKIGWHFIEVLEIKPAHQIERSDEVKELIGENYQRIEGLNLYLRHLRIREDKNVVIIGKVE